MATETRPQHFAPFFSPSQISAKTVIWALGTALAMVAAIWVFWTASLSIALTLAALLFAIAIDHAVQWLVDHKWRRGLAIATLMSGLVLLLLVFSLAFVPSTIHQAESLAAKVPDFINRLRETPTYQLLNKRFALDASIERLTSQSEGTSRIASGVMTVLSNAVLLVGGGLTIYFLALFMLIFGPALVRRILDETRRTRRPYYERIFRRIYTSLGGYIAGLALISGTFAAVISLFLAIIGVPFFLPLGLFSGILNLIPNIGPIVVMAVVAFFTFLSGGAWKAVAFIIFVIVYKQLENQLFGPLIFKKTASVDPLIGTIVVLFMTEIAGIPGALLAIPSLASAQIVLGEVLAIRRDWLRREAPEDAPVSSLREHLPRRHKKR